jgi:site-specific recombinase XerD
MPRQTYKKVIVTPELIGQINPENKKLVDRFLKEKATRSSEKTIEGYRSDANIFFVWNLKYNGNRHFVEIKKLEFADFFSYTTEEMKWGSSRNNRLRSFLSSLSQFIEKFYDAEYPNFRNVVLKTIQSVPKDQRREKTILTDEQVQGLLDYFSETNVQTACWLALAVYSGSRFAELLRFTTDIVDPDNTAFDGLFIETKKEIKTKGRGRNGKMLYKYILRDKFLPYYNRWLEERRCIMEKSGQDHKYLFIRKDGTPAIEDTARSWVATIERHLGLPFYPHSTRHFLCTELTRKKIPQAFIQFLFGWTSAEMYNIYNDMTAKEMSWSGLENLK